MDIDPLWALGGWFFLLVDCMATSSETPNAAATTGKFHTLLLFLSLLFISLILLLNPSNSPSNYVPFRRLLQDATPTTTTFLPGPQQRKSTHREFRAAAHEVPSGPNPISNSDIGDQGN